jgi:hypothetical protein
LQTPVDEDVILKKKYIERKQKIINLATAGTAFEYQSLTGNTHMSNLYECMNIHYSTLSGDKPENLGVPEIRTQFFAKSNLNK